MFIIMFIELGFKQRCFTPPQLFQSYFLSMEVSISQMFNFLDHNNTVLKDEISFQLILRLAITKEAIDIKDLKPY